ERHMITRPDDSAVGGHGQLPETNMAVAVAGDHPTAVRAGCGAQHLAESPTGHRQFNGVAISAGPDLERPVPRRRERAHLWDEAPREHGVSVDPTPVKPLVAPQHLGGKAEAL